MDAEELVHCQTVARMLVSRVLSKISQHFGRLNSERASGRSAGNEHADERHHIARNWREDDVLTAERITRRT